MNILSATFNTLVAIGLVLGLAGAAEALTFSTSGIWSSQTGGIPVSGVGTNILSWGIGPPESSYVFDGATGVIPDIDLVAGTTFKLGTFTHNNFPIGGAAITAATLAVNLDLEDGAFTQDFLFDFAHHETNNVPPCNPAGTTLCPDVVSLPNLTSSETISFMGMNFNLEILGFSDTIDGSKVSQFITEEGQANQTMLFARLVKDPTRSPEPSAGIATLVLGAVSIAMMARRRQT